jgi:hypothetical protein
LVGTKIATSSLAPDAEVVPCPRSRSTSRAAPPRHEPGPIATAAQTAKAQRDRVIGIKREQRADAETATPAIRIGRTAVEASWRDPNDLNVNRRFPKEIAGHRAVDNIDHMVSNDCISRRQGNAARRLRKSYELGVFGASVASVRKSRRRATGLDAAAQALDEDLP